jgi:hypothetical protein
MSKKAEVLLDETYGLNKECKFYTYIYLDPRASGVFNYKQCEFVYKPFYVGKGSGGRYLFHTKNTKRKDRKTNTIKAIFSEGLKPIVIKFPTLDEGKAFLLEKIFIENIGRLDKNEGPLFNNTDGGDGNSGNLTSKKLVADKKHNFITNHPMLNESIKSIISLKNSELWKSGEHPSLVFLRSSENRLFHSNRMKTNNPMKNPEIAKKVANSKKGKKVNTDKEKLTNRNRINSAHMKANNPMKNPETIKKMLETRKKNKELKNEVG